jgi:hypothetical protein
MIARLAGPREGVRIQPIDTELEVMLNTAVPRCEAITAGVTIRKSDFFVRFWAGHRFLNTASERLGG